MSLQDQISRLINPAPTFQDPEDDDDEITKARVVEKISEEFDEDDGALNRPSKLRKHRGLLLEDEDIKYAGRKVSRDTLHSDGSEHEVSEDEDISPPDDDDDDDDDEAMNDREESSDSQSDNEDLQSFNSKLRQAKHGSKVGTQSKNSSDYGSYDDDDDDGNVEGDDDSLSSGDDVDDEDHVDDDVDDDDDDVSESDDEGASEEEEEDADILNFNSSAAEEEIEKGNAAKAQLGLWDSLLESRIKMQKALIVVNQLPQESHWAEFKEEGGSAYESALEQGCSLLQKLGGALLELQNTLLRQNPETAYIADEQENNENEGSDNEDKHARKRRAVDDFENVVSKRHKGFHSYRNDTIQKWNDKTRLSTGKLNSKSFNAFDQSALKQIDQILSDKERLIKRTQLKRSGQRVLGADEESDQLQKENDSPDKDNLPGRDHLKNYDQEVFNDDDFYHQLLRELIEKKTSDVNDPIALSRQWLEVQKMRNKVKRKVDTKASKGRKIRYDVHPKLVNFMAPVDNSPWNDESRSDLYTSLFGQRHQQS